MPNFKLTEDQQKVFDAMVNGENIMLLGKGGCGKSVVLNEFIKYKFSKHEDVLVTAPTGIAALNLPGGTTIHRAFGLKPQSVFKPSFTPRSPSCNSKKLTVIIDEISMVRVDLFDAVARALFNLIVSNICVQFIVVGDFYQLAPVITDRDYELFNYYFPKVHSGFAFESDNWGMFDFKPMILTKSIRQNEQEFIDELDLLREGDNSCIDYFNNQLGAEVSDNAIRLYSHNNRADMYNLSRLRKLKQPVMKYMSRIIGDVRASEKPVADCIELCPGARVMAVANNALYGYVNGSMGTVRTCAPDYVEVEFDDIRGNVRVEYHTWEILSGAVKSEDDNENSDVKVGEYKQIPLKLGYAITMHKSQGQTYNECKISPDSFAEGQLYVALSRCRTIGGLSLMEPIVPSFIKASNDVCDFYKRLQNE